MYKNLVELLRNNDYTTKKLLEYFYHQKFYKIISKDLSRETNTIIPQQINLTGKMTEIIV